MGRLCDVDPNEGGREDTIKPRRPDVSIDSRFSPIHYAIVVIVMVVGA